jgi:hypothetical protein
MRSRRGALVGTAVATALFVTVSCGSPAPEPPEEVHVEGVVDAGVEPGCLILRAGADTFLLLGGDRNLLRPGRRVVVHGTTRPGTPTTCMQGVPLEVATAHPLD